jgi:hypothetical protein
MNLDLQSESEPSGTGRSPLRWPMNMRTYLLLTTCLILVGCSRQEESHRGVKSKGGDAVHWAFANKREIDSAIIQWSRDKMEEVKKADALSPQIEEQIRQYEAMQTELMHKKMEARGIRLPQRAGVPETPASNESYEALSNRVAEARAPIADIVDRRNRQATQYRGQYSTEKLIAEYVKDRFDLVVDSSDERFSRSAVLYRTTDEVLDITDGIIKLFKEKTKP